MEAESVDREEMGSEESTEGNLDNEPSDPDSGQETSPLLNERGLVGEPHGVENRDATAGGPATNTGPFERFPLQDAQGLPLQQETPPNGCVHYWKGWKKRFVDGGKWNYRNLVFVALFIGVVVVVVVIIVIIIIAICVPAAGGGHDEMPAAHPTASAEVATHPATSAEVATHPATSAEVPCSNAFVWNGTISYFHSDTEGTWEAAQKNCSSCGGSLVTPDSPEELAFVQHFKQHPYVWIGLRRADKGQPWKTFDGSQYDEWLRIEGDGNCAYINVDKFRSTDCITSRYWICKKPQSSLV